MFDKRRKNDSNKELSYLNKCDNRYLTKMGINIDIYPA